MAVSGENHHHHRHFVSSKTFPRALETYAREFSRGRLRIKRSQVHGEERKKKRSPGVRAALGLDANKAAQK